MPDAKKPENPGAAPDPHILTALRLRQLAEKASGLRDEPLVLAYDGNGKKQQTGWDLVSPEKAGKLDEPKIGVNFPPGQPRVGKPDWGKVHSVKVLYPGHDIEMAKKYDAFFWSRAAIEKFVLTYYLPLLPYKEWLALYLRVQGKVAGDTLYGIAHTYPSIPELITASFTDFFTSKGTVREQDFISESLGLFESQFAML